MLLADACAGQETSHLRHRRTGTPSISHNLTGRISFWEKSKTPLATNRGGGYRRPLNGRFVNTSFPFLVRDCRWSYSKNQLTNWFCSSISCMRRGVTGQGAELALNPTTTPLGSFPPWDGGTLVMRTASPLRTADSLSWLRAGWKGETTAGPACASWGGWIVRSSNLETAYG